VYALFTAELDRRGIGKLLRDSVEQATTWSKRKIPDLNLNLWITELKEDPK
jgi:hypothetical protein